MRVFFLMAVSVGCGLLVTSPSFEEDESVCYEWFGGTGSPNAVVFGLLDHTTTRTKDLKARFLDR
ncbi:MAG: hypothetical protein WBV18_13675 [Methyloceanibacter sp.]|jgi:hypothetical protein|uniref:hypothetical protein n=1 Tax=Methyloceanibacter sp. TaxID=1965321 RepID=UPI003C36E996